MPPHRPADWTAGHLTDSTAHPISLRFRPRRPYPRGMNALRLAALLVFTFGAFAYGAILVLWVRELGRVGWAGRQPPPGRAVDLVNGALVSVSFVWFLLNITLLLLRLGSQGRFWQIDVATVSLAFLFPPLILHATWVERAAMIHRATWSWLVALTYAVSLGVPAWCLWAFLSPAATAGQRAFAQQLLVGGLSTLFVWAAVASVALSRHIRADERHHAGRPTMLGLYGLMVLLFVGIFLTSVISIDSATAAFLAEGVSLAARSLPLVFLFASAYYENRFRFFDLFVKRGSGLLLTVALLTVWFALLLPVLAPLASTWAGPWIFAIALVPVVVVTPLLYRTLARALDRRWLGRRFTTVEAVTRFLSGLRSATSEAALVQSAEEGLSAIFNAPCAVRIDEQQDVDFEVRHETLAPPPGDGERPAVRFLLGRRKSDAPYFSEDTALSRTLAEVFAAALENVRLQERRHQQEQQARELTLHASRSELKALRAQINPHFLFNALNAIAGHIHRNPAVADRTIEQLADVFRYALRGAEQEWTLLADEMDFVHAYLEVERARFGERLETSFDVAPETRRLRVPTMMLQTLVENAVKHGASAVRGRAFVGIRAETDGGSLIVSVTDNGPGFGSEPSVPTRRSGGYGLVNIRERLRGYFSDAAALSVERDTVRGETVVSLTLPALKADPAAATGALR